MRFLSIARHLKARKIALRIILSLLTVITFAVISPFPALATENANGARVFSANCTACHAGGGNVIIATKTLKKQALQMYDMYSMDAIVYQLQNGKNAMPSFKGRLTDMEIKDVAAYVLDKAETGW
jgi:cytochrome c6